MVKFLKPSKAVIHLQGHYASRRKGVIVRKFDDGARNRPYGQSVTVWLQEYPSTQRRLSARTWLRSRQTNRDLQTKDKKVTASKERFKTRFEERFKTGKNRWFFTKLSFIPLN